MKRILAVGGDKNRLSMIEKFLERRLPEVGIRTASNPREGLEMLDDAADVVLLDAVMPGLDGYAAARRIKEDERYRHVPVFMLSGEPVWYEEADSLVDECLSKPFVPGELASRLRTLLGLDDAREKAGEDKPAGETSPGKGGVEKGTRQNHLPPIPAPHDRPGEFSLLINPKGEVLAASGGAALLGADNGSGVLGARLWDVLPGSQRERAHFLIAMAMQTKKPLSFYQKEGGVRCAGDIYPVTGPGGRITSLAVWGRKMPVSAANQSEAGRRASETQKMEAVGTLAGAIAEDLYRILWSVVETGQIVEAMDLPEEHPVRPCMVELLESARHARNLAGRILAFTGTDPHGGSPRT
ncbi:MAG: response regulator [Deltaproteobacteria bacterium]|nr:response regulator [Deltaproteobacteria bacterium]